MENYENTENGNTEDVRFESPSSKNKIKPEKNKKRQKRFRIVFLCGYTSCFVFFPKTFLYFK